MQQLTALRSARRTVFGHLTTRDAAAVLRRWLPLLIIAPLVSGLTAFVVTSGSPKTYRATSYLVVTPGSQQAGSLQDVLVGQTLARTFATLAQSEEVLRTVLADLNKHETVESLASRTKAEPVRDTTIIALSVEGEDAQETATLANQIAQVFISRSQDLQNRLEDSTLKEYEKPIADLQDEIRDLDSQIVDVQQQLALSPASPRPGTTATPTPDKTELQARLAQLEARRALRQQTLTSIQQARDQLQISAARSTSTVTIWQQASIPQFAIRPVLRVNIAIGALLGFLAVVGLMFVVEYLDDTIRSLEDASERFGLPVLGTIRRLDLRSSSAARVVVRDRPSSPESEAFRSIRTNIQFADVAAPVRRLVVASAQPAEGKSFVAANLAATIAIAGNRTLLIDADLRRPSLHRLFRASAQRGLTTYLASGGGDLPVSATGIPGLDLLPCGPLPPNPAELVGSGRMTQLLSDAISRLGYAVVVIDTPPLNSVTDGAVLAAKADGVLMVLEMGRTRFGAVARATDAVQRVSTRIIGFIGNKATEATSGYYYYYGDYASRRAAEGKGTTQSP